MPRATPPPADLAPESIGPGPRITPRMEEAFEAAATRGLAIHTVHVRGYNVSRWQPSGGRPARGRPSSRPVAPQAIDLLLDEGLTIRALFTPEAARQLALSILGKGAATEEEAAR